MAADKSISVRVIGLAEVQKALRQVSDQAPKQIAHELFVIAKYVAGIAARRIPSQKGQAAMSIVPRSTSKGASIAAGGSAAPYFQWLDFGGSVGRGHAAGANQGAIKRDWMGKPVGEGRYLYPAISQEREATAEAVLDAVARVARDAGFEVT